MPRRTDKSQKMKYISVISFVIIIWMSLIPLSEATAPAWNYHIEGITASAMSKNGDYTIVGTQENYFYVFDKFGNVIRTDNAKSEITAADISENGTFFVGTDIGYYFSTLEGEPQIDVNRNAPFISISLSDDGQDVIAGTERQIYLFFDSEFRKELFMCKSAEECTEKDQINLTAISPSGNIAAAATEDVLYIHEKKTDQWLWCDEFDGDQITSLAVSGNGQTLICGTEKGDIIVFYSDLDFQVIFTHGDNESINDLKVTEDGDYIVCGISDGLVGLLGADGGNLWEEKPLNSIKSLSISGDGSLIAAVGENLCLLDGSGRILQEMTFPEQLQKAFLSENGQYLCCVSTNEIVFFELYDHTSNYTNEYKCPSRKSLPLSDTFEIKEGPLDDIENPGSIQIGDVNGDGENEFVIPSGSKVIVTNKYGKILSEIEFSAEPRLRKLLDVTGDLIPEIIVGHNDGRMTLKFYDWRGTLLAQHEFYDRWWTEPVGVINISLLTAFDMDNDEKIEVICVVSSAYHLVPRGIYIFEYPTFSEEWYFPYAPIVATPTVVDLDGDGYLEILLGSNAPCNGKEVGDTDDCHAYVTAIDLQNGEYWMREIGESYKRVYIDVADLDGDGTNEIVCTGWSFENDWGKLFVLDKDGEYVRGEDNVFSHSVHLGGIADLDSDGKMEILTFSSEGEISVYDHLLTLVQKKEIDINMGRSTRALINDIDADGDKEIIVYSNDSRIYILNGNLDIEWTESVQGYDDQIYVLITNLYGCKNDLVILTDRIHVYSHQDDTDSLCPLWEITERNLTEKAAHYLEMAETSFDTGNYKAARQHFELALDIYSQLEDETQTTYVSGKIAETTHIIFRQNVKTGTILLVVLDSFFCLFIVYSWITKKRWHRSIEGTLLLSLPILLGLFQVYDSNSQQYMTVFIRYFVPALVLSVVALLRRSILAFVRTIRALLGGHKDLLVLSLVRADGSYRVSVESIEEKFRPVKESRKVTLVKETRENIIKKAEYMMVEVLGRIPSGDRAFLDYGIETLQETGSVIYQKFIPKEFSDILKAKFLLLEVEDTEIPWELLYSDNFFAVKYAISRRIVTTESVTVREKKVRGRRALIIADPKENLPGAGPECDTISKRLTQRMDTILIKGHNATLQNIASLFGQGFDIIHFAGHIDNGLVLSDGVMTPEEVKEYIVGTPVVVVNGCKSEELARAFLLGGAMAYVGTIYPVHDESAAEIAADFYELCLQYQIGEALRRAREYHMDKHLVWASLVMYGDPTLKLL